MSREIFYVPFGAVIGQVIEVDSVFNQVTGKQVQIIILDFLSLLSAPLHPKSDLLGALAGYPFSQLTGTHQVYAVVLEANARGAEIKVTNSAYLQ